MSTKGYKSLGEIIKDDMKEKGINGSAVARKMNVARQVINQIDRRKKFDIEFLQELKEASGLDYTTYAYDSAKHIINDPSIEYQANSSVTLTLNVSCKKDKVTEFSNFLNDVEEIARRYGYLLV